MTAPYDATTHTCECLVAGEDPACPGCAYAAGLAQGRADRTYTPPSGEIITITEGFRRAHEHGIEIGLAQGRAEARQRDAEIIDRVYQAARSGQYHGDSPEEVVGHVMSALTDDDMAAREAERGER